MYFVDSHEKDELTSAEIQNRINQLIDEHKKLNLGLYLHFIASRTIALKLSLRSNDQIVKEMTPMLHLKETLLALERFDFSGVNELSISLSGFESNNIERSIYSSIQQSLSMLITKCQITITYFSFQIIDWNPYIFNLFTSFDNECSPFPYYFHSMGKNSVIQVIQKTIKGKVTVKLEIDNLSKQRDPRVNLKYLFKPLFFMSEQNQLSSDSNNEETNKLDMANLPKEAKKGELCVNLTRLFKQLILIREQDQQNSNLIDEETNHKSNKEESLDQNNSTQNSKKDEKDYIINFLDEESTLFEQIVSISNVLQYLNRYSTHISKIQLNIRQCQDLNQQSDLASFVGHSDFAGIEVFQSVHITFPSTQLNQLDFLFLFKGCTIILPQSPDELSTLINKLKEVRFIHLGYFKVVSARKDSAIPICNFIKTHLNNLSKFEFLNPQSYHSPRDLKYYLNQILELTKTTNINQIDFCQKIIFEQNQLQVPWFKTDQWLGQISIDFPKIIGQFTKAISLELVFDSQNYPAKSEKSELIAFIRKLLEFRHVMEISILDEVMIEFVDIHEIIKHRKSTYHSIVAYDKFIKTNMLYHPEIILFDLYEYSH